MRRVVLTVHDEVVACVPDEEAEETQELMVRIMSKGPSWAEGLPLACEAASGKSYGDAK